MEGGGRGGGRGGGMSNENEYDPIDDSSMKTNPQRLRRMGRLNIVRGGGRGRGDGPPQHHNNILLHLHSLLFFNNLHLQPLFHSLHLHTPLPRPPPPQPSSTASSSATTSTPEQLERPDSP